MNAAAAAITAIVLIILLIEVLLVVPEVVVPEVVFCARRNLRVESLCKFAPLSVVSSRAIRNIERDPIEQAVVSLHHLVRDIVKSARHRVNVEHLVGDRFAHLGPLSL